VGREEFVNMHSKDIIAQGLVDKQIIGLWPLGVNAQWSELQLAGADQPSFVNLSSA